MRKAKKVVQVKAEVVDPLPVTEAIVVTPVESLFDDFPDDDEPEAPLAVRDIPALDSDLTPDEKKVFVDLLNAEMPLADRAKQLGKLARMSGQKTAGVGLRALIEINSLTGLSSNTATEAPPMFSLPEGAKVAILVQKVEK
jgi:hypothetical protein